MELKRGRSVRLLDEGFGIYRNDSCYRRSVYPEGGSDLDGRGVTKPPHVSTAKSGHRISAAGNVHFRGLSVTDNIARSLDITVQRRHDPLSGWKSLLSRSSSNSNISPACPAAIAHVLAAQHTTARLSESAPVCLAPANHGTFFDEPLPS